MESQAGTDLNPSIRFVKARETTCFSMLGFQYQGSEIVSSEDELSNACNGRKKLGISWIEEFRELKSNSEFESESAQGA